MNSTTDGPIISAKEFNGVLDHAMKDNLRAFKNASASEREKVVKFAGLFEVDGATAGLLNGLWNTATTKGMGIIKSQTFKVANTLGKKAGLEGKNLDHATAVSVAALNAAVMGSKYIGDIVHAHKVQFDVREKLARSTSQVLDELQGNHSLVALLTAGKKNTVFREHLARLNKESDVTNSNNYLQLVGNVAPGMVEGLPSASRMWNGTFGAAIEANKTQNKLSEEQEMMSGLKNAGSTLATGVTGPIIEGIIAKNEKRHKENRQPNSAMELILSLQKQTENGAKNVRSFALPRESGGKSVSLEEYIALTIIQHQKGMADIDPEHSEIRDALQEELIEAVKPMAEAIRSGEMSSLSLVRLLGEEMVIKNNGRAIADVDDVTRSVEEMCGKKSLSDKTTPKELYHEVGFTREQLKEALKALDGDEKQRFAAMLPDAVLKDAGMNDKQIAAVREEMQTGYEQLVAETVLAMASLTDEALKHDGLPSASIRQLRQAASIIEQKGVEGVAQLKKSEHGHSIEVVVLDWAVPTILGKREHYGTVMAKGRELLDAVVPEAANDHDGERPSKFADKFAPRTRAAHANDDHHASAANDHRERETVRRALGDHGDQNREF